ncbi:hypothetical protein ACLKA7_011985 [Drosophila subpalustris]
MTRGNDYHHKERRHHVDFIGLIAKAPRTHCTTKRLVCGTLTCFDTATPPPTHTHTAFPPLPSLLPHGIITRPLRTQNCAKFVAFHGSTFCAISKQIETRPRCLAHSQVKVHSLSDIYTQSPSHPVTHWAMSGRGSTFTFTSSTGVQTAC